MPEPVPPALRIALKNAIGGWGPYSVREIHDLFNSYGFIATDDTLEDAGARRTAAERYQAKIDWASSTDTRRYLDLVAEVLTNYPEESAGPPSAEGARLRRVLKQLGISADESGRLTLGAPVGDQPASSTEGIWQPGRPRLFISHISTYRREVGDVARDLNAFGFSAFVAHDAIEPSRAWQATIEIALATMDALVAYVTPNFHGSLWTDQEVGWALGRSVPVVPVNVGANPYGFFGSYQALRINRDDGPTIAAEEVTRAVSLAVFRRQRMVTRALDDAIARVLITAFSSSRAFDTTRRRYPLLELIARDLWSPKLRTLLAEAVTSNRQIRECQLSDGRPVSEAVRDLSG